MLQVNCGNVVILMCKVKSFVIVQKNPSKIYCTIVCLIHREFFLIFCLRTSRNIKKRSMHRTICSHLSGLSLRAITHNICYSWVCMLDSPVMGTIVFHWIQFTQKLASLFLVWRSRFQVIQNLMTALLVRITKLRICFNKITWTSAQNCLAIIIRSSMNYANKYAVSSDFN